MIAALINHLWQSTLFCCGAWLITLLLRANSASLRHWIWLLASVKFLVPFSLLFYVGSLIGMPAARIADQQPLMLGDALQSASLLVSPGALRATDTAGSSAALILVFSIWTGGALFVAARWMLAWLASNSLARAARPAPGALSDTRITDADIEPAVARVFRPVVLLPAALLGRLSDAQMNAVLAHEREHIERRDNLKANLHRLVETLFWFHPAVWWIGRQLLEERERACDERVLDDGHEGADYAAGILEVCRHCRAGAFVSSAATSGDLTRRVRYILGDARPRSVGAIKATSLLLATIATTAAPLFAGAVVEGAHRQELFVVNSRALGSAEFSIGPAVSDGASPQQVIAARNEIVIRNSSLRDLIAIAYGVERWKVVGGPDWLDSPRYDLHALSQVPVSDPETLDPLALQAPVTQLLASRFGLEIRVNQRCQSPCGKIRGCLQRTELTAMLPGIVDHLWQSAWICGVVTLLAFISRNDFAPLRLCMWRMAALKFVFPLSILVAIGGWMGFPVKYPDDPAPAALLEAFGAMSRFVSPARTHEWNSWRSLLATLAGVMLTVSCARWIQRQWRCERERVLEEARRVERNLDDVVRRPGFFNSALLTSCAMLFVALPLLAGAVEGRQKHYEQLVLDAQSLRDATVTMKPAAPGMGRRYRIDADERGVFIRNVTIQELAGIAYGVTRYYVRGDHFHEEGEGDWFTGPRYDVRVSGRVLEPDKFDPFALRASITRMLAERHGLEIYVNRKCQPPCGKYGVPMPVGGL